MTNILDFSKALMNILDFWMDHTIDPAGGFYGQIHANNEVEPGAPKGSVLNARILWTFAAAYKQDPQTAYLQTATRAFDYIRAHFIDREYGGVYWTVDAKGKPLDTKKQVYALAFTIYGLTEYAAATGSKEALDEAIRLYRDIETHSFDPTRGGYLEAFARDWSALGDMRLSAKDANEKKTMNTHLHILEAYTNLYRVWKDDGLRVQTGRLITDFLHYMINPRTHHLVLFLDEDWTPRSDTISFGHDIEASWLLLEAAEVIGSNDAFLRRAALDMVDAACKGLAPDGALYYEYEPSRGHWRKEKHWWVQAEAMAGLVHAWQISGDAVYLERFERVWNFIDRRIIDHEGGEWVWGLHEDNSLMQGEDKAGLWKCPYHNSRALLEVSRRLDCFKVTK
ncbi:AGE family epimerase/isomerase [Dinghuibacter silviterrae]|uniref:Cellobiose 2-epimerase n=1 Tax=Dinghuibacter silviterrae TaxID=1539049 RepID=A0A4R8DFC1_9BACT|nr:AGE family epimerase/isomerase [Dinghuibacter silviterrae]TDW96293.1 mannobiose 2-epimerase [Dinghuibacter silviterrae]